MAVKKLDWAVTYSNATGGRLRNEYEAESVARDFADRQKALASNRGTQPPQVLRLKPRRWEAGFQDHQGKWKTRRFDTKAEATDFLNLQIGAVRRGTYVDPKSAGSITVDQLHILWIERIKSYGSSGRRPATPKTVQGYEWLYFRLIKPHWEDYPLSRVTYTGVAEWTRKMKGVDGAIASADTRARASRQLSRMLDYGVGLKILGTNPAKDSAGNRDYVPHAQHQREPVYLTRPQLERLATCSGRYEVLVRFAGLTGLRWGEATALTVGDLDLGSRACVSVEKAYAEVRGRLVLGDTKGHSNREVPLPASLVVELLKQVSGKAPDALLFASANGLPMRNSNFTRRYFEPARQLASGSVGRIQSVLGVTETRRGLAVVGESTLTALHDIQDSLGLPVRASTKPDTWRALAAQPGVSQEQHRLLLDSVAIELRPGDMDFRTPVFHDLRHTAVSLYLTVTKNVKHVQRIAGHKDATTTLNTYAALFDDDFFGVAAGLDGLLAG